MVLDKVNTTVIYLTNNILDEKVDKLCRKSILNAIGNLPLISVSQKRIDFGYNICVGELPKSSLSICFQTKAALDIIKTDYVAIAEHDCLYTKEHFNFTPPDMTSFWYNSNIWNLQYKDILHPESVGMFSIFKNRMANSQLICSTKALLESINDRIEIMGDENWLRRYPTGRVGEPGAMSLDHAMRLARGRSLNDVRKKLVDYCVKYKGRTWQTKIPNIDIRHADNFTGQRRGDKRKFKLKYWGTIKDIFNEA